jgi:hypothetical protein
MKKLAISLACFALLTGSVAANAANVLSADTNLNKGERISSKNGLYHLIMQHDGNLVLYFGLFDPLAPRGFSTDTRKYGWFARMQSDGNFVVYSGDNNGIWQSGTGGRPLDPNYRLTLSEDGTLAIRHHVTDPNFATLIKTLYTDLTPSNGGPAYPFPMHKYVGSSCVNSHTSPLQSGYAARTYAWNAGYALGRCEDNVNVYGY